MTHEKPARVLIVEGRLKELIEADNSQDIRILLDGEHLTIEQVVEAAYADPGELVLALDPQAAAKIVRARQAVEYFVAEGRVVYGITTGFGAFKDKLIPADQVLELQRNIVMSHAVGVGVPFPTSVVRAMMLIRANTLAKGHSGIRPQTLDLLLRMIEAGVHPIVPMQGSLGASGDLAPLAHVALVLIGLGEAEFGGVRLPGAEALAQAGLAPVVLEAKEGLALTNGTALMAALGCLAVIEAENAAAVADIAGALSLEALHGTVWAFDARLHAARPHPPPRWIVRGVCGVCWRVLPSPGRPMTRIPQDAYTLRCIPQVHGACHDAIKYARWVVENRAEQRDGQPLDLLGGCAADRHQRRQFSRRTVGDRVRLPGPGHDRTGQHGGAASHPADRWHEQPAHPARFPDPGRWAELRLHAYPIHRGRPGLRKQNPRPSPPARTRSPPRPTWEDHVSNGPIAGRQARLIIKNVERILAIELMAAAQGVDFRRQAMPAARLGRGTQIAYALIRSRVPFLERDACDVPAHECRARIGGERRAARLFATNPGRGINPAPKMARFVVALVPGM